MKKIVAGFLLFGLSGHLFSQSVYPGLFVGTIKKRVVPPMKVQSFNLKDVRLLPSRFRDNMMRDSAWMVSIGANQLLHSF